MKVDTDGTGYLLTEDASFKRTMKRVSDGG